MTPNEVNVSVSTKRNVTLLLALVVVSAQPASGQVIRGTVRDSSTDRGIPAARITLLNELGDSVAVVASGEDGGFLAKVRVIGSYRLSIVRIGFRPLEDGPVMLLPSDTLDTVYYMAPLPVPLDRVTINAQAHVRYLEEVGFYDRLRTGFGSHVEPEWIERRLTGASRVADFVSHLPSVRMVDTRFGRTVTMRCGIPKIFVDDVPITGEIEEVVLPSDVLAIEVYRRRTESHPHYGSCALLIWTRYRAERRAGR